MQVLVFCTMTRCLDVLEDYLQWRGFEYERLGGATASTDRGDIVDRFNRPGESELPTSGEPLQLKPCEGSDTWSLVQIRRHLFSF